MGEMTETGRGRTGVGPEGEVGGSRRSQGPSGDEGRNGTGQGDGPCWWDEKGRGKGTPGTQGTTQGRDGRSEILSVDLVGPDVTSPSDLHRHGRGPLRLLPHTCVKDVWVGTTRGVLVLCLRHWSRPRWGWRPPRRALVLLRSAVGPERPHTPPLSDYKVEALGEYLGKDSTTPLPVNVHNTPHTPPLEVRVDGPSGPPLVPRVRTPLSSLEGKESSEGLCLVSLGSVGRTYSRPSRYVAFATRNSSRLPLTRQPSARR